MQKFDIDRRKLLKMGFTASALSLLPFSCVEMTDRDSSELLKFVGDSGLPVNNKQTGELTDTEFRKLASLCSYVNRNWELTPDLSQYLPTLKSDLGLKTGLEPSYLTEYKNALQLIDQLGGVESNGNEVWTTLLFADFKHENLPSTMIGRARQFVFSEIITHFVPISGGFKTFGLWNYRGYFGGPYISNESYRKMDVG